jgi:hypothetical protein
LQPSFHPTSIGSVKDIPQMNPNQTTKEDKAQKNIDKDHLPIK